MTHLLGSWWLVERLLSVDGRDGNKRAEDTQDGDEDDQTGRRWNRHAQFAGGRDRPAHARRTAPAPILAALAEFERSRIAERVTAGLARARAQGKRLGRPRTRPLPHGVPLTLTTREAARLWGVSKSTAARWLAQGKVAQTSPTTG